MTDGDAPHGPGPHVRETPDVPSATGAPTPSGPVNSAPLASSPSALECELAAARATIASLQQALEVSEARLGNVLEHLEDGFFAVDRELRFTYVNAAAERMWKRQRADLLGEQVWAVLPDLVDSQKYSAMLTASEQGRAVPFAERSAVQQVWVTGRAFPIPNGIAVAFQDMSEQHNAELARQESEDRYRFLFNSIDVGFCLVDMIYNDDGGAIDYRFLEANPVFSNLTGLHNPVGRTAREMVPELDESWFELYGNVARTGEPLRFENDAPAMGNQWFDVYAFRVGNEDSRRVAIFFTNITERKRLERAQQDFVGMVGHDLGNPLAVLRGWAQLMQRRQKFDAAGVDAMLEQAKRMERLVSDLREYVKFETGQLDLQIASNDVRDIAEQALTRARVQAPQREFTADLPPAAVVAPVDRDRLGQILDNLLSNAHKYTPDPAPVLLRLTTTLDAVLIAVVDQGPGIDPEVLPRLFDRFYRGDQVGTTQGLGLGLYIARMLVERQGGTISAESAHGEGTTFTLTFPQSNVLAPASEPVAPAHP